MSTPENHKRAAALRSYVTREIEDLRFGRIDRLSKISELAESYGYINPEAVRKCLRVPGLIIDRNEADYEIKSRHFPSLEAAWFIGVMSAGGTIDFSNNSIHLTEKNDVLLETFASVGSRLFNLNPMYGHKSVPYRGREIQRRKVAFNNKTAFNVLGDLRGSFWVDSVIEKHRWIIEQPKYSWKFIEGFFEKRGSILGGKNSKNEHIVLISPSLTAVNFLSELLVNLGLDNPVVRRSRRAVEGVEGIDLYRRNDLIKFASQVYSVVPEVESGLAIIRTMDNGQNRRLIYTDQQMFDEWKLIVESCGDNPSAYSVAKLQRQGIVSISSTVYANRFGGGSFVKAREHFERLRAEKNESSTV